MNLEKTVCYCMNVTNGKIKKAVEAGAVTLEQVQEVTKAGTACKKCRDHIQNLIDEFISDKK